MNRKTKDTIDFIAKLPQLILFTDIGYAAIISAVLWGITAIVGNPPCGLGPFIIIGLIVNIIKNIIGVIPK